MGDSYYPCDSVGTVLAASALKLLKQISEMMWSSPDALLFISLDGIYEYMYI